MNKNKVLVALFVGAAAVAIIGSCAKDKGKEPEPAPKPSVSGCDTVTYNQDIKAILTASCATPGCHAQGAPNPSLANYDVAKEKKDRIKARAVDLNPSPMPPPPMPQLSAAQKELINCWIQNGQKE